MTVAAPTKSRGEFSQKSNEEAAQHEALYDFARDLLPKFGPSWNVHNVVTLKRQTLSRLLYFNELYQKIVDVPGIICEFGVQWGAGMAQLVNLRGVYEPYNHSRKIIGFDTFSGFPDVDEKDGHLVSVGDYATSGGYEAVLEQILAIHESFSPIPHMKKFELVKGDASQTVQKWLERNPYAIISMAIFDMDVYKPTRDVLEAIKPRLTRGSVLVFDELNCPFFPGETTALNEVLGLSNVALKRHPHQPYCAWMVYGD